MVTCCLLFLFNLIRTLVPFFSLFCPKTIHFNSLLSEITSDKNRWLVVHTVSFVFPPVPWRQKQGGEGRGGAGARKPGVVTFDQPGCHDGRHLNTQKPALLWVKTGPRGGADLEPCGPPDPLPLRARARQHNHIMRDKCSACTKVCSASL